jgi:hypothetical protein
LLVGWVRARNKNLGDVEIRSVVIELVINCANVDCLENGIVYFNSIGNTFLFVCQVMID